MILYNKNNYQMKHKIQKIMIKNKSKIHKLNNLKFKNIIINNE